MITQEQVGSVVDTEAYDTEGNKIGRVGQVYLDDQTGEPEFATLRTGLFGTKETFVPLAQATFDGSRVTLPFTKDAIKDAPRIDTDGHLSEEEEAQLYQYYGLDYSDRRTDTGLPSAPGSVQSAAAAETTGRHEADAGGDQQQAAQAGPRVPMTSAGTAAPEPDSRTTGEARGTERGLSDLTAAGDGDAVRVEQELSPSGKGRLRKYIVTREVRIEEIDDDSDGTDTSDPSR